MAVQTGCEDDDFCYLSAGRAMDAIYRQELRGTRFTEASDDRGEMGRTGWRKGERSRRSDDLRIRDQVHGTD